MGCPKKMKLAVGFFAAFLGIAGLSACDQRQDAKSAEQSASTAPSEHPDYDILDTMGWSYTSSTDKMRGTTTYYASRYSYNEPNLEFPYQGGSPLELELWRYKGNNDPYPDEPVLSLSKGQFDCRSDGCILAMKFDAGPLFYRKATQTDCGSEQCLNISLDGMSPDPRNKPLMKRARMANVLTIEVPIWHYGSYQYEFHVAGLKWPDTPGR
jgi:hypothetical protein